MNIPPRRILIAEDDATSCTLLDLTLKKWGYITHCQANGEAAWEFLQKPDPPQLMILDWMMPKLSGIELLRRIRSMENAPPFYVLMLTTRGSKADIILGLNTGADDYLTKPFDPGELQARVRVGFRVLDLQEKLASQIRELKKASEHIRTLQGILPICSFCKKIRDDRGYWDQVEAYISRHSQAQFSHGICPDCLQRHYPDFSDTEES